MSANTAMAQLNQGSDEFDFETPAFEVNSSKESLKPEDQNQNLEFDDVDLGTTTTNTPAQEPTVSPMEQAPEQEEEMVTIRTRETIAPQMDENQTDLVEIRNFQDLTASYKQRQDRWGFLFSIGAEHMRFANTESPLDGSEFRKMFSNGLVLGSIELGPKFNTAMGSFSVLAGYGFIDERDHNPASRTRFKFNRYTGTVSYYLDMLYAQPYFVPYVTGGVWSADYNERSKIQKKKEKFSTELGSVFKFGALLNLDWIEQESSQRAWRQTGMQATFLNIYASTTTMDAGESNVNLESDMDFGASLVVEF